MVVTPLIIHPIARSIGLSTAHNVIPIIAPMKQKNIIATFFRLRLEMDALPRLFVMFSFVFIVRHFF